jgi:hypothetical protein
LKTRSVDPKVREEVGSHSIGDGCFSGFAEIADFLQTTFGVVSSDCGGVGVGFDDLQSFWQPETQELSSSESVCRLVDWKISAKNGNRAMAGLTWAVLVVKHLLKVILGEMVEHLANSNSHRSVLPDTLLVRQRTRCSPLLPRDGWFRSPVSHSSSKKKGRAAHFPEMSRPKVLAETCQSAYVKSNRQALDREHRDSMRMASLEVGARRISTNRNGASARMGVGVFGASKRLVIGARSEADISATPCEGKERLHSHR